MSDPSSVLASAAPAAASSAAQGAAPASQAVPVAGQTLSAALARVTVGDRIQAQVLAAVPASGAGQAPSGASSVPSSSASPASGTGTVVQVQTPKGVVTLHTAMTVPKGARLTLMVTGQGAQPTFRIAQMNGQMVSSQGHVQSAPPPPPSPASSAPLPLPSSGAAVSTAPPAAPAAPPVVQNAATILSATLSTAETDGVLPSGGTLTAMVVAQGGESAEKAGQLPAGSTLSLRLISVDTSSAEASSGAASPTQSQPLFAARVALAYGAAQASPSGASASPSGVSASPSGVSASPSGAAASSSESSGSPGGQAASVSPDAAKAGPASSVVQGGASTNPVAETVEPAMASSSPAVSSAATAAVSGETPSTNSTAVPVNPASLGPSSTLSSSAAPTQSSPSQAVQAAVDQPIPASSAQAASPSTAASAPNGEPAPIPPAATTGTETVSSGPAPLGAGDMIEGTVPTTSRPGSPLVQTPLGTLALQTTVDLPPGSKVTLQLTDSPAAPKPQATIAEEPVAQTPWRKGLDGLRAVSPDLADKIVKQLPTLGHSRLAFQLLALTSAARKGKISQQDESDEEKQDSLSLPSALRHETVRDLQDGVSSLRQPVTVPGSGVDEWQAYVLPFLVEGREQSLRLVVRDRPEGEAAVRERDEQGTRFLIDLDMTALGAVQLDGLVKGRAKRFDLIIRTHQALTEDMRRGIADVFTNTLDGFGMTGRTAFQVVPSFIAPQPIPPAASRPLPSA